MASILKVDQIQTPSGAAPTAADLGITLPPTGIKQVQTNSIDFLTINSGTPYVLVSVPITVEEGATVFVTAQGEQNGVGAAWQWHQLYRDNTAIGTSAISVLDAGANEEFHHSYWDTGLAAGTYTYSMKVWNGANYMDYGEHSNPMIQVVEFY